MLLGIELRRLLLRVMLGVGACCFEDKGKTGPLALLVTARK